MYMALPNLFIWMKRNHIDFGDFILLGSNQRVLYTISD